MFFRRRKQEKQEKKENEIRLRKLHEREVRYVSQRDEVTYVERVMGKYGFINIIDDVFSINCDGKIIFSHPIEGLMGSELMSLDGIILSYFDENAKKIVEVIAYYKYYRKLER
jgi:uncharacterized protein (UPF0305 family)